MEREINIRNKGPYPVYLPKDMIESGKLSGKTMTMAYNDNVIMIYRNDINYHTLQKSIDFLHSNMEFEKEEPDYKEFKIESSVKEKKTNTKKVKDCPACGEKFSMGYNPHLRSYICFRCNYRK